MTLISFIVLLLLTAKIPQKSIQANSKKSAAYLYQEEDLFHEYIPGQKMTTLDNYADSILLNIVYMLDPKKPLKSALFASYYKEKWQNADEAYFLATTKDVVANEPYTRYWHGQMIFLKPLLMVTDIKGIRLINVGLMLLLISWLGVLLIKKDEKLLLGVFLIGLMVTGSFMVPFCLEYISTFLVMLAACIMVVYMAEKAAEKLLPLFFLVGMVTVFFDFLTTETLTFTMPLVFLIILRQKRGLVKDLKSGFWLSLKVGILWGLGYSLTWAAKWGISTVVLKTNVFADAFTQVEKRTVGGMAGNAFRQCSDAIFRNIALLIPFNFAKSYLGVVFLVLGTGFILFCIWFLYRKKQAASWLMQLLILIGMIPYVRYIILSNHAYLHYFFTYRAQLVTVTVLGYAFCMSLDKKLIAKDFRWLDQYRGN